VRVLDSVRALLSAGHSIGEIARIGRAALLELPLPEPPPQRRGEPDRLAAWRRGMIDAAVAIDGAALERNLDEVFALVSAEEAIERVIAPAMEQLGELWRQGRSSVAGEHLASAKVTGRLLKLLQVSDRSKAPSAPLSIVACLPDEQHQLGALVAAYVTSRHGFRVSFLGPSLPLEDLETTWQILTPDVVCLSVSREALLRTHEPRLLELVRRAPASLRFILGGRGVVGVNLPELTAEGVRIVSAIRDLEPTLRAI
jgi:methanogenic corrinoid protein MtbC1